MSNYNTIQIPTFPDFSEIKIEHKKIFDEYFAILNPQNSEFCFGYLFAWRQPLKLKLTQLNKNLCVCGFIDDEPFMFEPIGTNLLEETALHCLKNYPENFGARMSILATEPFAKKILKKYPDAVEIIPVRDYYDYVYRVEELATLRGSAFQSKRNFINRFKKNYRYEYYELDEKNVSLCYELMRNWGEKKEFSQSLSDEYIAINELLRNFKELKLCGCVLFVEGKAVAFSVGENLNKNTVVMHIEKANTSYQGAYQMMNYLASNTIRDKGFEFVNREEDLGIPNLRKAKLSYHPAFLVEKYKVMIKK